MWHRGEQLRWGRPYPGRNGMSIQVHTQALAPQAPANPGLNLLQKYVQLTQGYSAPNKGQERLTDGLVAHTHRSCQPQESVAVRILPGRPDQQLLPDYIEFAPPISTVNILNELSLWGHDCEVELLEDFDIAFCFNRQHLPQLACRIFISVANGQIYGPFYQEGNSLGADENKDMQFLYAQGHPKAVIVSRRDTFNRTSIVLFQESFGVLEELQGKLRQPPPWPQQQPVAPHSVMYKGPQTERPFDDRDSRIDLGKTSVELQEFFKCSSFDLHTSFDGLQLPADLEAFLNCIPLLGDQHPDRFIIYVDGSSQGHQHHHPTAWIEAHGTPDAWAMIVLAECYATSTRSHQLFLVGWTAQQVHYDANSRFHLGSTVPGSLTAEREGMTWAFLWRIGQNSMVPTLFRSDSQLTCDQASGLKGATKLDDSFLCLRGAYQLLDVALPQGHLRLEHIYGHCGEPFNDFTDLMAKQEAQSSFFLPRLRLDMTSWRAKLPHLWLIFAQHLGGPQLHDGYLHAPVPNLPEAHKPISLVGNRSFPSCSTSRSRSASARPMSSRCIIVPMDMQAKLDIWLNNFRHMGSFLVAFKKHAHLKEVVNVKTSFGFVRALFKGKVESNCGSI